MQFEQISKDKRIDLPKPSVDTGMGLGKNCSIAYKVHMIIMKQIILKK